MKLTRYGKALEKIIPLWCLELNLHLVMEFEYYLLVSKYSWWASLLSI